MTVTRQQRIETLYRVMYESFTPKMLHWTPMWLKKRMATTLGWRLVRTLDADTWLRKLFVNQPGELAPIALDMFESCASGSSGRKFFNPKWLWRTGKLIWTGNQKPPETRSALYDKITSPPPLKAPGMLPDAADCMDRGTRGKRLPL
jgi:hypothetical protein